MASQLPLLGTNPLLRLNRDLASAGRYVPPTASLPVGILSVPPADDAAYLVVEFQATTASDAPQAATAALQALEPAYLLWMNGEEVVAWEVEAHVATRRIEASDIPIPSTIAAPAAEPVLGSPESVGKAFDRVHNLMRDGDGLQPSDALDELLKFLFLLLYRDRVGGLALGQRSVVDRNGCASPESDRSYAQRLRSALLAAIRHHRDAGLHLRGLEPFRLSTTTLVAVAGQLVGMRYLDLPMDLKSAALRVFIASNLRKGLGIYLTPDPIVQAVVDALQPVAGDVILDPACGTGSFLLHAAFKIGKEQQASLLGVDRNPRLVRVAELNLAPVTGSQFSSTCADSLAAWDDPTLPEWFAPGRADLVLTNPPFGVSVSQEALAAAGFGLASGDSGTLGSEVAFVERCLGLLRPGGLLAIVLPNSFLTNTRLGRARQQLDRLGRLLCVIALPPETFATTGTQTTTSVLIMERRDADKVRRARSSTDSVLLLRSTNVGFDGTGRFREGSDLSSVSTALRRHLAGDKPSLGRLVRIADGRQLQDFADASRTPQSTSGGKPLDALALVIRTGKTPPRVAYEEDGHFIVKVGNLTGSGVDFTARDRNHVGKAYIAKVKKSRVAEGLILKAGDILLTSSAHHTKYIAKKVDIIESVPEYVEQPATYVGELMLVRADPAKIDPYRLLAYLRSRQARRQMQGMIRGQTAHLMHRDLRKMHIPEAVLTSPEVGRIADLLKDEARRFSETVRQQRALEAMIEECFPSE